MINEAPRRLSGGVSASRRTGDPEIRKRYANGEVIQTGWSPLFCLLYRYCICKFNGLNNAGNVYAISWEAVRIQCPQPQQCKSPGWRPHAGICGIRPNLCQLAFVRDSPVPVQVGCRKTGNTLRLNSPTLTGAPDSDIILERECAGGLLADGGSRKSSALILNFESSRQNAKDGTAR